MNDNIPQDFTGALRKVFPAAGWSPSYWNVSQDPDLSFKALGLHTYVMSKPPGWEVSAERIARERKEGVDAIRGAMRELAAKELMETTRTRGVGGKFTTSTVAYAIPKSQLVPEGDFPVPVESPNEISAGGTGTGFSGPGSARPGQTGARKTPGLRRENLEEIKNSSPLRSNGSVGEGEPPIREEEDFLDSEPETRNPEPDPTDDPVDAPSASQDQNPEPKQAPRGSSDPSEDSGSSQAASAGCPSEDLPPSALAEKRAEHFIASFDWAQHPTPTLGQLKTLIAPVRWAFNRGWSETDLLPQVNAAIAKAEKWPGVYLKRFLGEFLEDPPIAAKNKARERSREKWFNGRNAAIGSGDPERDPKVIAGRGAPTAAVKSAIAEAREQLAKRKRYEHHQPPAVPESVRG